MSSRADIPFELIPAFLLLAEELNISRAARRLQLSQPALTRKLRSLEDRLGAQLFLRQSRGLALTSTGRELKKRILPLFDTVSSAIAEIKDSTHVLRGPISFGCFSELGTHLLAPALFKFARLHPEVSLDIRFLSEADIVGGVAQGMLHLGVASKAPENENIRSYKLLSEKILLVTSKANPDLEKNPHPRFAGFRAQDRLLHSFLKNNLSSLGKAHPPVDIAVAVNSHAAMLTAVKELNLYAALPQHSISSALKQGDIRVASRKEFINDVHLILPESEFPEKKISELSKFLKRHFKGPEEQET